MFFSAQKIQATVFGDPIDPRSELPIVSQFGDLVESLDEGVLRGILGVGSISQHAETNGENLPVMQFNQHPIRAMIAVSAGGDKIVFLVSGQIKLPTVQGLLL
jgi:hypothetical protein